MLAFLAAEAIQGAFATASLFTSGPSMERNAFAFGFSLRRLLLGFLFGFLTLSFAGAAFVAAYRPQVLRNVLSPIDSIARGNPTRMVGLILALLYSSLTAGYVLLLFILSQTSGVPAIVTIAVVKTSVALWLISLPLLFLAALVLKYRQFIRTWPSGLVLASRPILVFAILLLASLHWLTLAFQAKWIQAVPGWFWPYTPRTLEPPHLWLAIAFSLGLCVTYLTTRWSSLSIKLALLLIGGSYALQVFFGFAQGHGFESIRLKYQRAQFSDVMQIACESSITTLSALRNYEETFGHSFWYGTKPPGLYMLYSITRDAVQAAYPATKESSNLCDRVLSSHFAWSGPLLASLLVLPLMGLQRQLGDTHTPPLAPLLCMSAPGMLLMLIAPDQMLYPLLSSALALLWVVATNKPRPILGFIAGVSTTLAVFITFSLLPLLALGAGFLLLTIVFPGSNSDWRRPFSVGFATISGIVVMSVALALAFDYNPLERLLSTMALRREIRPFSFTTGSLLRYGILNNLEFALWVGLPLVLLAARATWRSFVVLVERRTPTRHDLFNIAFLGMYILLNVFGEAQGEVGRVWLFLVPLMAVPAAKEAFGLSSRPISAALFVMILQLTTSVVAFYRLDWPW